MSRIVAGALAFFGFNAVVAYVQSDIVHSSGWMKDFQGDCLITSAFIILVVLIFKAIDGTWIWKQL